MENKDIEILGFKKITKKDTGEQLIIVIGAVTTLEKGYIGKIPVKYYFENIGELENKLNDIFNNGCSYTATIDYVINFETQKIKAQKINIILEDEKDMFEEMLES